jgi:dihydropteroate synthase
MNVDNFGFTSERTLIFGILNITPDSFSDGGEFFDASKAIEQAKKLKLNGADVIDIGGESTRPGATRISSEEESKRVLPVIEALAAENFVISIDTMRSEIAAAAVEKGAKFVNDVSGGKSDPNMFRTVADLNVPYILMHWRAQSKTMDELAVYQDLLAEVKQELKIQIDSALSHEIKLENLIVDPGLGFAKNPAHNWKILSNISQFKDIGLPLLVGHSRKRFLNELSLNEGQDQQFKDFATAAISYQLALDNIWAVRVHDAKSSRAAINAAHRFKQEKI